MSALYGTAQQLDRLKQVAAILRRDYGAERVIVYGSVARGDATEDSDLDIFVQARTSEPFYKRMAAVRRLLRPLRGGLPISPLVLTPAEVDQRLSIGDQFVEEILTSGVEL